MKLTLGFSPCPNDTFIFDALVNGLIDTGDIQFEVVMEDVETLNRMALQAKLDITKISYGVLPRIISAYQVLTAGGALGRGVGPLLIANRPMSAEEILSASIALPGMHTTAHLLFSLAFPDALQKNFMLFSDIEDAVLNGRADAGVIIHENRFTYAERGLVKLLDLGDFWEQETGNPIPLGGIVMSRKYDRQRMEQVNTLIRNSVLHARTHYPKISPYVRNHAQEMEEAVMRQHIDLYVNEHSIDLGSSGKAAVWQLLEVAAQVQPPSSQIGAYEVFL